MKTEGFLVSFLVFSSLRGQWETVLPKEAVQVPVPHVLEHHGQRLSVRANAVKPHDVLVLQHGQKLSLPLEVLPGRLVGVLQSLQGREFTTRYVHT